VEKGRLGNCKKKSPLTITCEMRVAGRDERDERRKEEEEKKRKKERKCRASDSSFSCHDFLRQSLVFYVSSTGG